MPSKPFSESAARNRRPILEVLQIEFRDRSKVLEIGSGTGQHAVFFAEHLPAVTWQTSDRDVCHEAICAWVKESGLDNLRLPLCLDVLSATVPPSSYDAVFSANTAHIMSTDAVARMFVLVGETLQSPGVFCLYGPFRQDGIFNAGSNAEFDSKLRSQNPEMGIRDIEWLDELANQQGLTRHGLYAMPANNHLAVWRRTRDDT